MKLQAIVLFMKFFQSQINIILKKWLFHSEIETKKIMELYTTW